MSPTFSQSATKWSGYCIGVVNAAALRISISSYGWAGEGGPLLLLQLLCHWIYSRGSRFLIQRFWFCTLHWSHTEMVGELKRLYSWLLVALLANASFRAVHGCWLLLLLRSIDSWSCELIKAQEWRLSHFPNAAFPATFRWFREDTNQMHGDECAWYDDELAWTDGGSESEQWKAMCVD